MDKIIEMITDVPYGFVNQGHADYMFKTDKSQHWILIDENNNLVQMVGYKINQEDSDTGKLYDTGKINVTDHTLKILIASLVLIPFRDEIYKTTEPIDLIKEMVAAWDSLPEGNYSPDIMSDWLMDSMKPVIDKFRTKLKHV